MISCVEESCDLGPLAIAKQLIEAVGAKLDVGSQPDREDQSDLARPRVGRKKRRGFRADDDCRIESVGILQQLRCNLKNSLQAGNPLVFHVGSGLVEACWNDRAIWRVVEGFKVRLDQLGQIANAWTLDSFGGSPDLAAAQHASLAVAVLPGSEEAQSSSGSAAGGEGNPVVVDISQADAVIFLEPCLLILGDVIDGGFVVAVLDLGRLDLEAGLLGRSWLLRIVHGGDFFVDDGIKVEWDLWLWLLGFWCDNRGVPLFFHWS